MSSINGSKKTSMSLPACLGLDTRFVNRKYFHLWHNHGGRLNIPKVSMKGQVVADFIVDHAVDVDHLVDFVQLKPWGLYFDGSVCSNGQGAECVIISPSGMNIDLSIRLGFACTNNHVEY
jgi:hypothetical protein